MKNLVIVESPSKSKTIEKYLGGDYHVVSSKGHIRDLATTGKGGLGIDVENGFIPNYKISADKKEVVKDLQKLAKKSDHVYLASDPDREGEAIAWHLATVLGLDMNEDNRIVFHEITKQAILEAMKHPQKIDQDLVKSQETRRMLDRIIGFRLSKLLQNKIQSKSAGRVQSVALRLIVERENEIRKFKKEEYWTLDALCHKGKSSFTAGLQRVDGKKAKLKNKEETDAIIERCAQGPFIVQSIERKVKKKEPKMPFITSTLQQEASTKLGFGAKKTMQIAQKLYEGIDLGGRSEGLITYMRSDSTRLSPVFLNDAFHYIETIYGKAYRGRARQKNDENAQDAHEAIRPVNPSLHPDAVKSVLSADQYKLYKLIWARFVASQMASAKFDTVQADLDCSGYRFKAAGSHLRFNGYLTVYEDGDGDESDSLLPALIENQQLPSEAIKAEQHFTEPPARFNEGSLVKFLEEKGIGRPSTFATIVTTIIQRGYVKHEGKSLVPTDLGVVTTRLMLEHFPDIVGYDFTAHMEEQLDDIENGGKDMVSLLSDFYKPFEEHLEKAMKEADEQKIRVAPEETDIFCEKCGARMVVKNGRFGRFAACPNYPECRNTKPLEKDGKTLKEPKEPEIVSGMVCEKCGGPMVQREGRYGSFFACANYPKCTYTKQPVNELEVHCPLCGKKLVTKRGKNRSVFYSCSGYPECSFSSWDLPTKEKCPRCGGMLFVKKGKNLLVCHNKDCAYTAPYEPKAHGGDTLQTEEKQ